MKKIQALQDGNVSVEYLIASAVFVTLFFAGSPSLVDLVLQAIRIAYARYAFSMGLP
jgi:hypothetical protein